MNEEYDFVNTQGFVSWDILHLVSIKEEDKSKEDEQRLYLSRMSSMYIEHFGE